MAVLWGYFIGTVVGAAIGTVVGLAFYDIFREDLIRNHNNKNRRR